VGENNQMDTALVVIQTIAERFISRRSSANRLTGVTVQPNEMTIAKAPRTISNGTILRRDIV
jgi:hypothetical protein